MTFLVSDDARWITGDTIAVYASSKLSAAHAVDVRLGSILLKKSVDGSA
jgi:hypothetical protein